MKTLLMQGAKAMNIALNDVQATSLISYLELIIKWNKTYNLSAICTMEIGVKKHLLDCLSIMPYVDESPLLDVGAGAGLPGIVLSIMKPTLTVSVLDSVGKKCRFMQFAKSQLALKNLSVVNTRLNCINRHFLPTESSTLTVSVGFIMLSTIPGNPAPAPTSSSGDSST
jgi:16S rRNA (guanine527-N7)-methyltransferase